MSSKKLENIKHRIATDNLKNVFRDLFELIGEHSRKNELLLLKSSFNDNKKKHDLKLISYEEYGRIRSQTIDAILSLTDDLSEWFSEIEENAFVEKGNSEMSAKNENEGIIDRKPQLKEVKYNIMFIGKAGVGKTSLINYLYGQDVGTTGVGLSITKGFQPIDVRVRNQQVRIFDTEGLSAGSSKEWKESLVEFLSRRSIATPASNWLHSIFYCFGVGGSRIELFEIDILRELLNSNYKVTIVFTKADQGGQIDIDGLRKTLEKYLKEELPIIPICSIDGKVRLDGTRIRKFGKDNLEEQLYFDFWKSICTRLPLRCEHIALQLINIWEGEQELEIRRLIEIEDDLNSIVYRLKYETDNFTKTLKRRIIKLVSEEIEVTMKLYDAFSDALGYPTDKLERLDNMNLNVRFDTYKKATAWSIATRVFDFQTLFSDFSWYSEKLSSEIRNLNINPRFREKELLKNLKSASSLLRNKIKGEQNSKYWNSLLSILGKFNLGKEIPINSKNLKLGLRHLVAESLIDISPYGEKLKNENKP